MGKIKTFDTQSDYDVAYNTGTLEYPNLSKVRSNNKIYIKVNDNAHDHYLTFEALSSGTVNLKTTNASQANTFQYSTNDGKTWNSITASTTLSTIATLTQGQRLLLKGNNIRNGTWDNSSSSFWGNEINGTAQIKLYGNINSLMWGDDFIDHDEFKNGANATFFYLFYNYTNLKNVENLILPAKHLVSSCYQNLFDGCSGITKAPYLPFVTVNPYSCASTFANCTSLSQLQNDTLYPTILKDYCYRTMFYKCPIVTAPVLPALNLVSNCYQYMFRNCTALRYLKAMFLTSPSASYTQNWVQYCNNTTAFLFVKNRKATWSGGAANGALANWTIQYADE